MWTEAVNVLNERPVGSLASADASLNILTPNNSLQGRQLQRTLGNGNHNPITRYQLIQTVVNEFWRKWTEFYAPNLMVRRKWNTSSGNLCRGDVVIIAVNNGLRANYRLGLVKEGIRH